MSDLAIHPRGPFQDNKEYQFNPPLRDVLYDHTLTTRKTFGYPANCTPGPFPRLRSYHCDHLRLPPSPLPPLKLSRVLQRPADARRERAMAQAEAEECQGPMERMAWQLRMLTAGRVGDNVWSPMYTPEKEVGFEREDWYGSGKREEWERRRTEGDGYP